MHSVIPLFAQPASPFLTQLAREYPLQRRAQGMILNAVGVSETSIIFIESGICSLCLGYKQLNTISLLGAGSAYGVVACLNPYQKQGIVRALTPVEIRMIPREHLLIHLQNSPEDSAQCLRYVININSQYWHCMSTLLHMNAQERFLFFVSACISRHGSQPTDDGYYTLYPTLTQTQLAEMLAINRITLARVLRPLRDQGLISKQGTHLQIHHNALALLHHKRCVGGEFFPIPQNNFSKNIQHNI